MTNEHYLVVSYFVSAFVCLGLGAAVYLVLRAPLAAVAAAVAEERTALWKQVLAVTITIAGIVGFVDVNYKSCAMTYGNIVIPRQPAPPIRSASPFIASRVFERKTGKQKWPHHWGHDAKRLMVGNVR